MADEPSIKLGIEMTDSLHRRVKIAAAERRVKIKEATRQAFEAWLADRKTTCPECHAEIAVHPDGTADTLTKGITQPTENYESATDGQPARDLDLTVSAPQETEEDRWVAKLRYILRGPSSSAIKAVLDNIDAELTARTKVAPHEATAVPAIGSEQQPPVRRLTDADLNLIGDKLAEILAITKTPPTGQRNRRRPGGGRKRSA